MSIEINKALASLDLRIMDWTQNPMLSILFLGVCLLFVQLYRGASRSRGRALPPGPRPLPVVGNLLDIPKVSPWLGYRELSRKYGRIVSLQVMGQHFIVIDDPTVAVDLLEKRSGRYSSRPESQMATLMGWGWNLGIMPYGQSWRQHRRMFWQYFHPGAITRYHPSQEEAARQLLSRLLLSDPKSEFTEHLSFVMAASIIEMMYGLKMVGKKDKYLTIIEEGCATIDALVYGSTILEFFPVLARVPTWVPGTAVLRRLQHSRRAVAMLREVPWKDAKAEMKMGHDNTSFTASISEKLSQLDDDSTAIEDEIASNVAAVAYTAGFETTYSTMCSFFLAMSLYPDVQRKAQEELDAVVGPTRLPEISDRERLPYINAIVKESLRWHCAVPLSLPHACTADDDYDGYFIPAGTTVLVNAWSMLHNPDVYPQPDKFVPGRFMKDGKLDLDVMDPARIAFGFGRRICPGRYHAETSLFINIASVLHTFSITPAVDEQGHPILIQPKPTAAVISFMEDCRCTVKPRGYAEALIRS